jgi:uncharacterized protein (UPF0276 family)
MTAPVQRETRAAHPIPARAGIGLRAPHYREVIATQPATGWFEVHSENYFGDGGAPLAYLDQVRQHYPISLHGVGLSLGSTDALNDTHLERLKTLIARIEPGLVSEHLCWSSVDGVYLNDLLPLPYTEEALAHVTQRILQAQDRLGRTLLIENVSSYVQFRHSTVPEWEFIAALAARAGCGLLLDVNNVYVSAMNHDFDPLTYLRALPRAAVKEIHLAGHAVNRYDDGQIWIDDHGSRVAAPVWALYSEALRLFGPVPTLIEWDTDIPALDVLLGEARHADALRARECSHAA